MSGRKYGLVILALAGGVAVAAGFCDRPSGPEKAPGAPELPVAVPLAAQPLAKAEGAEAGIKAAAAEYAKAFNASDAKTAAALWTAEGEYVGADGAAQRGAAAPRSRRGSPSSSRRTRKQRSKFRSRTSASSVAAPRAARAWSR